MTRSSATSLPALLIALAVSALAPGAGADRAPHPEPRVIIDATVGKKGSVAASIQAAARRGFWGKAVGCYKAAAADAPDLHVDAALQIEVQKGAVKRASIARRGRKRPAKGAASATDQVTACLAKRLVGLAMPADARGGARLRVRIAPGDPPASDAPPAPPAPPPPQ